MNGQAHENIDRRRFIKGVALTAVAATATGAGAALLGGQKKDILTNVPANLPPAGPAAQTANTVISTHNDAAQLLARLAESQAENMRLQTALDATQRQLDSLQGADQNNQSQNEALHLELEKTTAQVGVMGGLVALYEQLDGIDVSDMLENGLTAVTGSITELIDHVPTLNEGVEAGQKALAEIENHIPLLENGRLWLENHTGKLIAFYAAVEGILGGIVDRVGPFLEMLNDWFQDVKKWLPFGIGNNAASVMNALTLLIGETPATVSGLNTNIAQPLDIWLARDGEGTQLHRTLIKPLREKMLTPINKSIQQAQQVQSTYQTQLAIPTGTAVASQRVIREQISIYREQHQLS